MNNFWIGFEKQAANYGGLVNITKKVTKKIKNADNVLDYKKLNTPKVKPGSTLDYSKMPAPKQDNTPLWKKRMEAKRHQTAQNTPGVVHDSQRGVVL